MSDMAVQALLNMILSLILIGITWWALQSFKFDLFIRNLNGPQARLLQIILSVAIGHGVARFFVDYMEWANLLRFFF